jgi:hypothetical protein
MQGGIITLYSESIWHEIRMIGRFRVSRLCPYTLASGRSPIRV